MEARDVAIAILAAGSARRFGADKLMIDFDGRPLGVRAARALAQVEAAAHFAVCQAGAAVAAHYEDLGYAIVDNPQPDLGLSGSLHLAVEAAAKTEAHALLIALADMPFVQTSHVEALIAACDGEIIASSNGNQPMPPAIFPRSTWNVLLSTSGDAGARHILARASMLTAPAGSLRDVDTVDDLVASNAQLRGLDLIT